MDKWKLRVALKVLDEVKVQFAETKQFIEECLEQESQRKHISGRGSFFYKPRSKELAQNKHFLFCSEYVKLS